MKKLFLISVIFICFGAWLTAQNVQSLQALTGLQNGGNREVVDLVCPGPSAYSQLPNGLNGLSSTDGALFYDNILTSPTGEVTGITFWMIEFSVYDPLNVDIIFRHDDGGLPGMAFQGYYMVPITAVYTGEWSFSNPVVQYTYTFPSPITVTAGDWVGIADYPDDFGVHHHYWTTSSDGDHSSILYPDMQDYYHTDLAFCLDRSPSEVPISNWAIVIGFMLMLSITFFTMRRFTRM